MNGWKNKETCEIVSCVLGNRTLSDYWESYGYSFEAFCLEHIASIENKLGHSIDFDSIDWKDLNENIY